ncbi:LysR family transcriptional regulator [Roseateles aquatilis]|uniref:LysR family transcriptional regulator n=1 Tax=Roseateles aquatilis TaxID=431061 RepID=A0A246JNG2_9BURK|nr:LysR family transcriptional regulator [Roseateles aquatilis]OWQ93709.1 LysR family transcriptional regulator [Roseateles aquatilis]
MPRALSLRSFLRKIDVGSLDLFVLVCESGSMARAAESGQLAASAISKRIAELEALAQAPLLTRHARGVRPTEIGALLLEHAHAILMSVGNLHMDLAEVAQGVRGRVRVCASASAVEQFLPADIASFLRRQPDIRVDLRQASSRMVAQAVHEGTADVGVCGPSDGVLGLEHRPYRQEHLVLVVPRGHPLARLRRVDYARTLEFPQVGLRDSSTVQQSLAQEAISTRRVLRRQIEVDSLSAMCRMVEAGLGIGVMPQGAFRALADVTPLRAIPLADAWARRELRLYAQRFADLPAVARRFVDQITSAESASPQSRPP